MERPKYYIKYKGKFRDLIPAGWEFQKLYGHNYRQYSKNANGEEYGQACRIWQHLGGYLEVEDLFSNSYLVVNLITDGKLDKMKSGDYWPLYVNLAEGYITSNDSAWQAFFDFAGANKAEPEKIKEYSHEYYKVWRSFSLDYGTVAILRDLLDKNLIEVVEDNRKY